MGRDRALTPEQARRMVAAHERGVTYPTLAARYGVSVRTVRRYVHNGKGVTGGADGSGDGAVRQG